jgi:FKBP-type peptidyl-prolyl cis-trans isomerase
MRNGTSMQSLFFLLALLALATGSPAQTPQATPAAAAEDTPRKTDATPISNPSGLQYIDFKVGDGATPQKGEIAIVHYTGWLADGKKIDSSRNHGKPFGFKVGMGQVIKGWDEGVASMRVGGIRRLLIPPQLGYGEQGVGKVIPPNAQLTFDIELLRIKSE